jgi:GNAT superfamily N-acetyltransferase
MTVNLGEPLAMPFAKVRIALAGPEDVDHVLGLINEAARWLLARGIRQWPVDPDLPRETVARQLRQRECYLAWEGDQAVGTFSLQLSDPPMWGAQPDDALYLHGLAVRRTHRGLGRHLLSWAERMAAAAGRSYLRLDCMAENPALRAYYERAGYRHRGDVKGRGWAASLYEKAVGGPAPTVVPPSNRL